jgi:hypothetical protein
MRILMSLIALLGVLVSAGCQPILVNAPATLDFKSSPTVTRQPFSPTQVLDTPDRSGQIMTKTPERVPPTEVLTPVTGEVPAELYDSILKDLAKRTGAAPEKISAILAQAIVWNDGSLGCPQPGGIYTMALVNGFQVILAVGDQKYDYHAAETGYFFLCESGLSPISPVGTPNS